MVLVAYRQSYGMKSNLPAIRNRDSTPNDSLKSEHRTFSSGAELQSGIPLLPHWSLVAKDQVQFTLCYPFSICLSTVIRKSLSAPASGINTILYHLSQDDHRANVPGHNRQVPGASTYKSALPQKSGLALVSDDPIILFISVKHSMGAFLLSEVHLSVPRMIAGLPPFQTNCKGC